ncbi:MAG: uncharacterized protein A8A55_1325 [Amphiamblys sp. WSBS2006]|nr:MAG: uncharacterized protein A8A55_1325 [Amphiamblys sp. WSBS2006]
MPKLSIRKDCEVELVLLDADKREQVAAILDTKEMFCLGRVKKMYFKDYAVGVFSRISIRGDCEVDVLVLGADKREHVAAILDDTVCLGRVKCFFIFGDAVNILLKLERRERSTMEIFSVCLKEDSFAKILKTKDKSIELGRISQSGFSVPEPIKRKLRYTLVDKEGNEIEDEGERKEALSIRTKRSCLFCFSGTF